jgi:drug/metabolite transporter (DMT)-like permease
VTSRTASLLLLAVTAVWGWTFVVVQDAVRLYGVLPFLAVRFAIAAAGTGLLWGRRVNRGSGRAGLAIGAILAVGYLLQTWGLRHTSATNCGLITGLFVVVAPVADRLIYGTHLRLSAILAAVLSLLGLGMLTGRLPTTLALGDLLTLGCALAFGVHVAVLSRHAPRHDSRALTTAQMLACAVLFAVLWPLAGPLEAPPRQLWPALLVTGLVASGIAYAIQTVAQRHLSAVQTAVILTCEPVFAGLFGYALAGDRLSPVQLSGGVVILAALLLAELAPRAGVG